MTCTLEELLNSEVNMFTTVFIGNSQSVIMDGKMGTKRGYESERDSAVCRDNGR